MLATEGLTAYLRERPSEIRKLKNKGTPVVGFFVGDYVPEEIIYASGAVPLCLCHGGDPMPANAALSGTTRFLCPFSRAQFGEKLMKEQPYYNLVDYLVVPITCQHLRRAGDMWEYYTGIPVFRLGIPYEYDGETSLQYYVRACLSLKSWLEKLAGIEITDSRLEEAIGLYNRMRSRLKDISLLRRQTQPPISTLDFIKLNHASFYADPGYMAHYLEELYRELSAKKTIATGGPRLLLTGPNVACGDYKVLELIQEAGGAVVAEEIGEGVRYYWGNVSTEGDPIEALARKYLPERLPCAFMRNATRKRLDFITRLAKDFNVAGIVWYQLLYCDTYDIESYYFIQHMERAGYPVLKLESDYEVQDRGTLRTRIEAFLERLGGR